MDETRMKSNVPHTRRVKGSDAPLKTIHTDISPYYFHEEKLYNKGICPCELS